MAKKHGFRGTPVRPSSRLSSVAGVFERRGDPLVSPRQGLQDFGRNLESENPDLDQYFAKRVDILRPEQIDTGEAFRKSVSKTPDYDPKRKAAQIMLTMRREMREAGKQRINVPDEKQTVDRKINCPMEDASGRCPFRGTDKQVSRHLRIPPGALGACSKKGR